MKTLFIIGITLFFLLSLLKKATRFRSAQSPPPSPGPTSQMRDTRATLARRVAENPDDARLWAELGAAIYLEAQSRGAEVEDPDVTQADEHFRTAVSLAPQDASILADWAQWKARLVAENDELRMFTYEKFVKPKLRKASELAPGNGEIPYYHAALLAEIAEGQLLLAEEFDSPDNKERHTLLRERDLLLWDAVDLAHQAERKRHDRLECLSLRAELFVDLAEERDGGEEKYLLQEAKTSLDEYRRLSGEASPDEEYVTLSLEHLRGEAAVPVARPTKPSTSVPSVVELGSPHPRTSAPAPSGFGQAAPPNAAAAATRGPVSPPVVSEAKPSADLEAKFLEEGLRIPEDAFASAPAAAQGRLSEPETVPQAVVSSPTPIMTATNPDFSRAAAALAPPMPAASAPRTDFPNAPNWEAPAYNVPDYARPQGEAEHNAPATPTEPGDTGKNKNSRSDTPGAHRPLSYRPLSR